MNESTPPEPKPEPKPEPTPTPENTGASMFGGGAFVPRKGPDRHKDVPQQTWDRISEDVQRRVLEHVRHIPANTQSGVALRMEKTVDAYHFMLVCALAALELHNDSQSAGKEPPHGDKKSTFTRSPKAGFKRRRRQ